jgi:hypothetical protein
MFAPGYLSPVLEAENFIDFGIHVSGGRKHRKHDVRYIVCYVIDAFDGYMHILKAQLLF